MFFKKYLYKIYYVINFLIAQIPDQIQIILI